MRCHEARKTIDHLDQQRQSPTVSPELQDHLKTCEHCLSYAVLSGTLDRVFEAARADDLKAVKPIDQQRTEVDARLRISPDRRFRILGRESLRIMRPFYRRPAFRLSMATLAVVLAAMALVPFEYYQTVGYDLNLQGVSRQLANSDEQICELLTRLGLVEAGVDVKGCDTTCTLAILDLKSEREANLVAGAIARLNEPGLTSNIVPIRARSTRSLLEQANDLIRRGDS